jgi:Tol biopolymer transport system component
MGADGNNPKNLMGDMTGRAIAANSTVSPDGRYIVYSSDLTGTRHIWRMDIDGSNPVQLTQGGGEDYPNCSPDGKWVFFTDISSEEYTIWKAPIDGGNAEQVISEFTNFAAVSPDGKLIACFYVEPTSPWKLAVFPIEGGQAITVFPNIIQGSPPPRWTPDGRGITYGENSIGASRIWVQPLAGGPPRKLIEIETDRVFDFDWSRDGKSLACVRGTWPRNIVLVKNFR